jgi:hypothetical protein
LIAKAFVFDFDFDFDFDFWAATICAKKIERSVEKIKRRRLLPSLKLLVRQSVSQTIISFI